MTNELDNAIGDSAEADETLEVALARALDSAATANRELDALTYAVSHDLRAPLRSIDGFSQALLEDYGDTLDSEGKRYLSYIRDSTQRMAQLLEALLALSRLARMELRPEPVDMSALARTSIAALAAKDPERRVDVSIEDGLSTVADRRLFAMVLDNLLGNAWKFTAKRDPARIELGSLVRDERRIYFVRDNGAGFDMTFAAKLFGAFQRLHPTSEFEGLGVGLATVQRIINRHHGKIWGEAAVDAGATFFFTLDEG